MISLILFSAAVIFSARVDGLFRAPFLSSIRTFKDVGLSNLKHCWSKSLIAPIVGLCISSPIVMIPNSAIANTFSSTTMTVAKEQDVPMYFGVGCFWHVQHEFIQAEKRILDRSESDFSSLAGYAGGLGLKDANQPRDLVCYHNMLGVGDYGKKGYGEVVGMSIPGESIKDFAKEYFSLFSGGDRPDKGDRGPEYRSMIGLPGGIASPYFADINELAKEQGLSLKTGQGNDPDTLGKKTVWLMDSNAFPFRQAEIYHQYHDGFMPGEQYPESYNALVKKALASGKIAPTGCPDLM